MATLLDTSTITEELDSHLNEWAYNGLDCCVTEEVFRMIEPQLGNELRSVYDCQRGFQGPALEMMLRGVRVDRDFREAAIHELSTDERLVQGQLDFLCEARTGKAFLNANSPKQLQDFFYGDLSVPPIQKSVKGVKKISMDRETLEKIETLYFDAAPFATRVLLLRDLSKQRQTLSTGVDSDGRLRTSYNIAGTETFRWSSSKNAFGTGGNLQNWRPSLRRAIIPDEGKKFANFDLEQAESRVVGLLALAISGDASYLDACESGDLHTTTCKMVWPHLPWPGDARADRALADQIFYRDFSYRDMSKRGGHGSNYLGTPFTMARHLKVETKLMEAFQRAYFSAFPCIPKWHTRVAQDLHLGGVLYTPLGHRRKFFGRLTDAATLREAVAFVPQSTVGVWLNLGMYRVWEELRSLGVELLLQVHDSILIQYPETADEAKVIAAVKDALTLTLHHAGRAFSIPVEAKIGWNWANYNDDPKRGPLNPDGLIKWKGSDARSRTRKAPTSLLDRVIRPLH